jgi:hypothetical protein
MNSTLSRLVKRLEEKALLSTGVISWSCPIPAFGNPRISTIATLGLNPSNREFVDAHGKELDGDQRRFHTLNSLGIKRWSDAEQSHVGKIAASCKSYFIGNPYDTWFRRLDSLLTGTDVSYYGLVGGACHLDLIPYATAMKWTELTTSQRAILMDYSGDAMGMLLRDSAVRLLVLNGKSVVESFETLASAQLERQPMSAWSLPRRERAGVTGVAYSGVVTSIGSIKLGRRVRVIGFNHNIQSSFGVTRSVSSAIRKWLTDAYARVAG